MDENEEFEFRLRAEQEAKYSAPAAGAVTEGQGSLQAPPQEASSPPAASPSVLDRISDIGTLPGRAAAAGVEMLGSAASSVVGGGVGLAKGAASLAQGQGLPAATAAVRQGMEDFTYQPRSPLAQRAGQELSDVIHLADPITAPLENALNKVSPNIAPAVAAFGEAALSAAPAAGASKLATAAKAPAVPGAARLTGRGTEAARAAGYEARPSDFAAANPGQKTPGMTREKLTGSHDLQKDFTLKNQERTDTLAREEMKLKKGERITPEALDRAREPHNAVYDETAAKVGSFKTPEDLQATLDSVLADGALPKKQRDAVAALKVNVEGQTAINVTRYLRSKARTLQRSQDAKTQAIGDDLMDASDAIESALEQRLEAIGEADQFTKFKSARTALAKVHDYQVALKNGHINAHELARLEKKYPNRMTGNAAIIANAGDSLPGVTGLSTKATGTGSVGVPTSKTGVIDAALSGAGRLALKATGTAVDSPKFQNKFGREAAGTEASYKPGPKPPVTPSRPAPGPQLGTESLDFTPTAGVTPPAAARGGLGMELVPDPVPNAQMLPSRPDFMTAEAPAPVRYDGGIDFTSTPSLADTLAGELGLAPDPMTGQRFAPVVGRDPSGVPHGDMIDFVTDGMSLAQPALSEQLGLPGATLPIEPRMSLVMEKPPGRVGKPKSEANGKGTRTGNRDSRKKR